MVVQVLVLVFWQVLLEVGGPGLDGRQANGRNAMVYFQLFWQPREIQSRGALKKGSDG